MKLDATDIKDTLRQASIKRRNQLKKLINKLHEATQAKDLVTSQRDIILAEKVDSELSGHIDVEGTIYAGVEVRIIEDRIILDDELKRTRISLGKDGVQNNHL